MRGEIRNALGRIGVWTFGLDGLDGSGARDAVADIEAMGWPALWAPEGMGSPDVFARLAFLASASSKLTLASGIANIGARHAFTMANGARMLGNAFPGRVVLALGVGHEYQAELRGTTFARPAARMRAYLDAMDQAPSNAPEPSAPVPLMLAALGDRMLRLAAERTAGAHSYFVPVSHTEHAREVLGPEPVLAVEQTVAMVADASEGRRLGRGWARHYLELPNYANNLRRLGFSDDDVAGAGSDRLIDATIAWGSVGAVAARVREHLDAGADHVCVQVVTEDDGVGLNELRELGPALLEL